MLKKLVSYILYIFISINVAYAETDTLPIISGVGGDFSAIDSHGNAVEFNSYSGNVVIISFGYTNCADICPFTLGYLKQLYSQLNEEEQQRVKFLFVTVDPEYDTPAHLNDFLSYFNKDFIGISGTKEQTDHIVSLYQAQYNELSNEGMPTHNIRRINPKLLEENEKEKAKLFSHSVSIYLVDKEGFTRSIEYTGTPKDKFVKKIQQLIKE